jgi:two-component system, cell cycle sensor histidine kinase and response regulator CckA
MGKRPMTKDHETTDQQRLADYYRALVENSADAIALLDRDGTVTFVSESVKRLAGIGPEEVVGTDPFEQMNPEDISRVRKAFDDCAKEPGNRVSVEYRTCCIDGVWQHREALAVNRLDDPALRAIVVTYRDITARKKAEVALLELEGQVRHGQKMEALGRLAGGIAHDFNNLLTVIIGYSDLLLQQVAPGASMHGDISEIRHAAASAAGLTRQLLAFSRKQILQPQVLDLNGIVERINALLRRLIGEDIALRTRLATPLHPVRADAGQIEQIIMNLALNARDAMPQGGRLTIETANVELSADWVARHPDAVEGPHVKLAITDTGIGMDPTVQAHLFEPFFTTKERGQGTGLGLATVYGIVKQSGGSIFVDSEPGRGSLFCIFLPRTEQRAESPTTSPLVPQVLGTETVLLVEDQGEVRRVTRNTLTRQGYTVLEAASGADALSLVENYHGEIHLLLADVVMPGMSGRDLARQLLTHRPGLRVLYTSGYIEDAIALHGILEPGVAFIQKPFAPNALLQAIRDVLGAPGSEGREP